MTKEDDVTPHLRVADTHDFLLMLTDRGRVFATRAFELAADASRTSRGTPVTNIINLEPREQVNAVVTVSDLREDKYLVMATVAGQVKRMHLPQISNIRKGGLNAFNLKAGDELQSVVLATPEEDIIMVSEQGMAIRFPSTDIRARQRAAGGMRGMALQGNDKIVSADVVRPTGSLLVVTRRGYGKLSEMRRYRQQKRGGKGLITLKIARKNGRVAAAQVIDREVDGDDTVLILTEKAQVIRVRLGQVRETGRITQGVIMAVPGTGDNVSAIRAMKTREAPAELLTEEEMEAAEATPESKVNGVDTETSPEDAPEETMESVDED